MFFYHWFLFQMEREREGREGGGRETISPRVLTQARTCNLGTCSYWKSNLPSSSVQDNAQNNWATSPEQIFLCLNFFFKNWYFEYKIILAFVIQAMCQFVNYLKSIV